MPVNSTGRPADRSVNPDVTAIWSDRALAVETVLEEHLADPQRPGYSSADGLVVAMFEDGRLTLVGQIGYPEEYSKRFEGPLNATGLPVTDVLRTRRPEFVESPEQLYERYPLVQDKVSMGTVPKMAWAFLPLVASGRVVGASILSFNQPRLFDEAERTLLTTLSALEEREAKRLEEAATS